MPLLQLFLNPFSAETYIEPLVMSTPKFQIPLSTSPPLSPSLQKSLIDHLSQHSTTIPDLLDSLQSIAVETGFSDRVAARTREIADKEEEGKEVDAEVIVKRIVGEIMATLQVAPDADVTEKGGDKVGGRGGESLEMPKEMVEAANKIVREGLEQVAEIEVPDEKEARENGWL